MKAKRTFAAALAATMSLSALSGLAVHAESAYALGDVDMDGVITGHDSAMVSRYLNVDSELFTEEQLELADFNGDGTIDQTDADLIHENEVYMIGDVYNIDHLSMYSISISLRCYITAQLGNVTVTENGMTELPICYVTSFDTDYNRTTYTPTKEAYWLNYDYWEYTEDITIDALVYNLMDADGDGVVSLDDTYALLYAYVWTMIYNEEEEPYIVNGRYDLVPSNLSEHSELTSSVDEYIQEYSG